MTDDAASRQYGFYSTVARKPAAGYPSGPRPRGNPKPPRAFLSPPAAHQPDAAPVPQPTAPAPRPALEVFADTIRRLNLSERDTDLAIGMFTLGYAMNGGQLL